MRLNLTNIIKLILASLLFLCLADMPYGYYQFVRLTALIGFALLAYRAYLKDREIEIIIWGSLALLFQPLFKIALGREMWNIVDVIVGIGLLMSIYSKLRTTQNEHAKYKDDYDA